MESEPPNDRRTVLLTTLWLLIQCYEPKPRSEGRFEAHARRTDLQYVWSGRERLEFCDLHAVQPNPSYDANGNVYIPMGDGAHSHLRLQTDEVAVLLPQDAQAPCLRAKDNQGEDHGTAFDVAWPGKAAPTSLYSAIRAAGQLASGRTPNATPSPDKQTHGSIQNCPR